MYAFNIKNNILSFFPQTDIGQPVKRIAAFDLDNTLIKPLPGKSNFDPNPTNWQFWNEHVIDKLQSLIKNEYLIVIFTNQGNHTTKTIVEKTINHPLIIKFNLIATRLKAHQIYLRFYAALGPSKTSSHIRKPQTSMWNHMLKDLNCLDYSEAFFCGDAAGRQSDHSDCDREFASKIGIPFQLPENFFQPQKKEIASSSLIEESVKLPEVRQDVSKATAELIFLIGFPGAGKTTYARKHFTDTHHIISQDVMNMKDKRTSRKIEDVIAEVQLILSHKQSVVLDRTNMTHASRSPFINLTKNLKSILNIKTKFLIFDSDLETSYHRNVLRSEADQRFPKIPKIVFYKMKKEYEPPNPSEGEIILLSTNLEDNQVQYS